MGLIDRKGIEYRNGIIERQMMQIAVLEAELAPWRRMCEQLEALRGAGVTPQITLTSTEGFLCVLSKLFHEVEYAYGPTLPAAVAAAYGKAVGDE